MRLDDLERCVQILFKYARLRGVQEITFDDVDLYWTVASPEWTQIYAEPKPAVGSFTDDEEALRTMLTEEGASAADLDRVAHLLRRLSDQLAFSP